MSEIVEVELVGGSQGCWQWRATSGPRRQGTDRLGVEGVAEGDRLVMEIAPAGVRWAMRRVLRLPDGSTPGVQAPPRVVVPLSVGRSPGSAVVAGAVVLRRFRFSADSGGNRSSKLRPCVVVSVDGDEVVVHPIFGSNSAVRREGMGRRLLDWRQAGLCKPSVVAAIELPQPAAGGRPIGMLSDRDRFRILDEVLPPASGQSDARSCVGAGLGGR